MTTRTKKARPKKSKAEPVAEQNGHADGDELSQLKTKLGQREKAFQRVHRLARQCRQEEATWEEKKAEAGRAKKTYEKRVLELLKAIESAKNGQIEMDFPDDGSDPTDNGQPKPDASGKVPLSEVRAQVDGKEWRVPEGVLEKLTSAEIVTVSDLEAAIGDGRIQKVGGIGQKMVDKLSDLVMDYRRANPIPAPDEPSTPVEETPAEQPPSEIPVDAEAAI